MRDYVHIDGRLVLKDIRTRKGKYYVSHKGKSRQVKLEPRIKRFVAVPLKSNGVLKPMQNFRDM